MGSPTIFAGSRTKLLSSAGLLNKDNSINDNNGIVNFIKNGHAEVSAVGWEGYNSVVSAGWTSAGVNTTTDTITSNAHTLTNGQRVTPGTLSQLPSPLAVGTMYYVINITTNTFQLSLTKGGSAVDLTTTGLGSSFLVPVDPVAVASGGGYPLTRSTTSPLSGSASFLFTRNTPNLPGIGSKYDFTIDTAPQAKVLSITFDYIINSGTFTAGSSTTDSDLEVWIWDKTNNVYIQPSTYKLFSNSTTISAQFSANFQTAYNSTSYSLLLNNASIGSSNYEVKIDNVQISPTQYTYGTPITDWTSFSMTIGGTTSAPTRGTVTSEKAYYRRVGRNMEVMYALQMSAAGAAGSGAYLFSIPTGYTIDTTQVTLSTGPTATAIGTLGSMVGAGTYATTTSGNTAFAGTLNGFAYSTTQVYFNSNTAIAGPYAVMYPVGSSNTIFSSAANFTFNISVPITGWSSCVQMSDSTTQQVVAASYYLSAGFTSSPTIPINFDTKEFDTTGSVTPSATAWKFTAPVQGVYAVNGVAYSGSLAVTDFILYKNGSAYKYLGSGNNSSIHGSWATEITLNAGDYIDIRTHASASVSGGALSASVCAQITIQRISGPASIAANDTVAAFYYASANTTGTSSAPFNFDTKVFDYTGSVTTGAAWKFTAPVAGLYSMVVYTNGAGLPDYIRLYKNGVFNNTLGFGPTNSISTLPCSIKLNAGDYIDFRAATSLTANGGTLAANTTSWCTITKTGTF